MLKCSNPKCETHKGDEPMFTVNITVGDKYEVAEVIHKIPHQYFICVYCDSEAEGGE